jgi:signal transduction histidine kinase/FixJ family two-component response regulator
MEKRPLHILLVDDDEDDYIITRDLLFDIKGQSYQLDWRASYEEAVAAINQRQHDVYLVDYRLGAHNGLELLRQAISQGVQSPFILLTGQGDRAVDLEAMRAGAVDYLVKEKIDAAILERSIRYAVERKRAEAEREALLESERRLNAVSRAIGSNLDLSVLLPNVVKLAAELVGAAAGGLALITNKGQSIQYPFLYNLPHHYSEHLRPRGQGLAWHIVQTGESLLLADYAAHPKALRYWQEAGICSFIGVPVTAGSQRLGALALFSLSTDIQFGERELALAESVGRQAGFAIQNARLFAETQHRAEELQAALTRLEELDRLKSAFIRNASHELRTPLAIMRGYVELLVSGQFGELSAVQQEPMSIVTARAKMLTNLVDDIIAVLNAETADLNFEPTDLAKVAQTVSQEFQLAAKRANLALDLAIAPDLPLVMGAPFHLERVLDNLLSNALKFTPAGGTVLLSLRHEAGDLVLEVKDTGIGIPAEELDKIFDRFYQVDGSPTRRYGGIGLGLALVKEIVAAHHGRVHVSSILKEGSCFQIRFPALQT